MARRDRSGFDARQEVNWPTLWPKIVFAVMVAMILGAGALTVLIQAGWWP